MAAPTFPPAPARFSTTTCWPSTSVSLVATMRLVMSTPPPGGNGLMMRSGRFGNACAPASIDRTNTDSVKRTCVHRDFDIASPLQVGGQVLLLAPLCKKQDLTPFQDKLDNQFTRRAAHIHFEFQF